MFTVTSQLADRLPSDVAAVIVADPTAVSWSVVPTIRVTEVLSRLTPVTGTGHPESTKAIRTKHAAAACFIQPSINFRDASS